MDLMRENLKFGICLMQIKLFCEDFDEGFSAGRHSIGLKKFPMVPKGSKDPHQRMVLALMKLCGSA
ncbi:hypothetical protein CsSME_00019922 [Camellia sinensis var. sinensis]